MAKKATKPTELDSEIIEERDDAIIGQAFRWSLLVIVSGIAVAGGIYWWTHRPPAAPPTQQTSLSAVRRRELPTAEVPKVMFSDITQAAGIEFVHRNGAKGDKLLPETMGGGGGFFDYDQDGDQDLLLIDSMEWLSDSNESPSSGDSSTPSLRLYANDGQGKFEEKTQGSGLDVSLYGMGVAFGDMDNDGRVDVFVTAVGSNRLFRNLGDGKFQDLTESAGVGGDESKWSSSAGFFDYDNDGDLDLFVCNYVKWSKEFDLAQNFQLTGGGRAYGRPQAFEGTFPYLYRNEGNATFSNVSAESGVQIRNRDTQVPLAKSLGVVFADLDSDGWMDIVVANDTVQNFLLRNRRDGTFEEIGASSGVAFDTAGNARGAMGIDVARFRNSDALGVAIGNFANEMTALYVAPTNHLQFVDEAVATGLGPNTRLELTFGLFFFDYDLDGRLDLFAANGHLEEEINRVQPSQHYEQPPHLFWNGGAGLKTEFIPVKADKCGEDLMKPTVGRGAAYADIDGDGDQDLLVVACGKAARLLRNDQDLKHHWLRFQLVGAGKSNRDAIGAWVEVKTPHSSQRRQVMPTRSYQSQVELPVTFGLGKEERVEEVTIVWPDGTRQSVTDWKLDAVTKIEQSAKP